MRWITPITADGRPFYHAFGATTNAGAITAPPNKYHFPRAISTCMPAAISFRYTRWVCVCVWAQSIRTWMVEWVTIAKLQRIKMHIINFAQKRRNTRAHARHKFYHVQLDTNFSFHEHFIDSVNLKRFDLCDASTAPLGSLHHQLNAVAWLCVCVLRMPPNGKRF